MVGEKLISGALLTIEGYIGILNHLAFYLPLNIGAFTDLFCDEPKVFGRVIRDGRTAFLIATLKWYSYPNIDICMWMETVAGQGNTIYCLFLSPYKSPEMWIKLEKGNLLFYNNMEYCGGLLPRHFSFAQIKEIYELLRALAKELDRIVARHDTNMKRWIKKNKKAMETVCADLMLMEL